MSASPNVRSYRAAIVWLPVAYLLHIVEELRFPAWVQQHLPAGASFTMTRFLVTNALLWSVCVAVVICAWRAGRTGAFFAVTVAWVLFANMFFHAGHTVVDGIYSPGVVTACLLYPPLVVVVTTRAWRAGLISPRLVGVSAVVGIGAIQLLQYINLERAA